MLVTAPLSPAKDREEGLDNGWEGGYSRTAGILIVDGGWTSFDWYGSGVVFATGGPFAYDADTPVTLRITDDYCPGDRFRVYLDGEPILETTYAVAAVGAHFGPREAFIADHLSSGIYSLPRGQHEINIQVFENPFRMGRAHMRLDTEYTMEVFEAADVSTTFAADGDRLSFSIDYQAQEGGGGLDPMVDDVTIRDGTYLVTIPAGAMSCTGSECVYQAAPPGPTMVYINDEQIMFAGQQLGLCPARNPAGIAIWVGDDHGQADVRCEGTLRLRR
jgi:hypothetical protein